MVCLSGLQASFRGSQRKENEARYLFLEQPLKKVALKKILNLQACGLFGGFSAFFGLAQGQIKIHDGPVTAVCENQLRTHDFESHHSEASQSAPVADEGA
jgi:hypothetical protein